MAQASFHLFSDLPPEVQDLVWDAAVRPADRSHVHSFIISDRHYKHADAASVPGFFLRFRPGGRWNAGYKLAVPYDDPNTGSNSSVYLSDSGLWTACKQSRAAMERRFPVNEWWSDMPEEAQLQHRAKAGEFFGEENVSRTASYRDSADKVRHVTICPQKDLTYFSPLEIDSINWFHHYAFDDVPLIDRRGYPDSSATPSFLGLDVALDYHPLMLGSAASQMIHCRHRLLSFSSSSLTDMVDVFHESTGRTMWFIDHRLRRSTKRARPSASTQRIDNESSINDAQDERRVFYSNDCVFTEVRREDQSEWTIEEKHDNGTVFDFFDMLHNVSNGRLELEGSDRMKVLACEAAPGAAPRTTATWDTWDIECVACVEEEQEDLAPIRRVVRAVESDDDDLFDVDDFVLNLFE